MRVGSRASRAETLRGLFEELERASVPYCVLRNYERLPSEVGNDIDILIDPGAAGAVEAIVRGCARSCGWNLGRPPGRSLYFILFRYEGGSWEFFRLDIVTRLHSGGITYSSGDSLLASAVRDGRGFQVPRADFELFHLLLHSALGPDYNRGRYLDLLSAKVGGLSGPWEALEGHLAELFPEGTVRFVVRALKAGDISSIFEKRDHLRRLLLRRLGRRGETLRRSLGMWADRLRRFVAPPGRFVVLIGPDGVGKSTAAGNVARIARMFHRIVAHTHLGFRPAVLPTRRTLAFWKRGSGQEETQKISGDSSGKPEVDVMGLPRLLYFVLDYLLGYFVRIRPVLRRNGLVLAERYYYDYLGGFRKNPRVKPPLWLVRLLFSCLPEPDVVILLENEADAIRRRREELAEGEIRRQLDGYEAMARRSRRFLRIRTDRPPDEVAIESFAGLVPGAILP